MDNNRNDLRREQIIDCICLAASYGMLLLLPVRVNGFFYLLFGLSAFLFCVGFFRLGISFDGPYNDRETTLKGIIFAVTGGLVNLGGIFGIYLDHGSERSMFAAVLLMIEALVFYALSGSSFKAPEHLRLSGKLFRIGAVLMILFGIVLAVREVFEEPYVIIATMLLIEGICLWKMGGGSNPMNNLTPDLQVIPGLTTPIRELQETFADTPTQLGRPWMGKMKTLSEDALIYGPSEDGYCVYGYYQYGQFCVFGSSRPYYIKPEDAEEHKVKEVPGNQGLLLSQEELLQAYVQMFTQYAESGITQWKVE